MNKYRDIVHQLISQKIQADYHMKTYFYSALSLLASIAFIIYNGILGILYGAVWNISICIYYIALFAVKSYVLLSASQTANYSKSVTTANLRKRFAITHMILALLDLTLIAPISEMALGKRSYHFGLIPAIAMAAYTTYRLATCIFHYKKSTHTQNLYVIELHTINMIDTLVAILTLQNAMIIAKGGFTDNLRVLVSYTCFGILLIIIAVTIASFYRSRPFCSIYHIDNELL